MCGGIGFKYDDKYLDKLRDYLDEDRLVTATLDDIVTSFFWDRRPFLPIKDSGGVLLCDWGNRDSQTKLPLTGWAKIESLMEGRWDYLNPVPVDIVADKGYEDKVWFDIPQHTLKGIVVARDNHPYIYMLTQPSSRTYAELTHHPRQPVFG